MEMPAEQAVYELICVIVRRGEGTRVLRVARAHGVTGGTILPGHGTAHSWLLEMLDLCDIHRDVVLMAANQETARRTLQDLDRTFVLRKHHRGIAFCMPLRDICGVRSCSGLLLEQEEEEETCMHNTVMVVTDRGRGEDAVEAAQGAGAPGATIIHGRGAGIHETQKVFSIEIEPEKDIVLIVCRRDQTEPVVEAVRDRLELDKPGNGIVLVQDVSQVCGM